MKIKYLQILPLIVFLAVFSCKKDDDSTIPNFGTAALKTSIQDSIVCDTVHLDMRFDDERGVDTVMYYIDGKLVNTTTKAPFTYAWNTNEVSDALHNVRIEVVANDRTQQTLNNTVEVYNNLLNLTVDPQYLTANYSGCKVYILISDYKGNTKIYKDITNVTETIVKNVKGFKEKEFMVSLLAVSAADFRGYSVKTTPGDFKLKSDSYTTSSTMEFTLNVNNVSNCSYLTYSSDHGGTYDGSLTSNVAIPKTSFSHQFTSFIPGAVYVLYKNINVNKFYGKLASNIPQGTTTYNMDLSDAQEIPVKNVDVSALAYTTITSVSSYGRVGAYQLSLWRMSSGLSQGVASVPVYIPENIFSKISFNVQTNIVNGTNDLYSYQYIPSKVDALTNNYQVEVNNSSSFKATTTGAYDYVTVHWSSGKVSWDSFEPNGSINAIRPSIPSTLLDANPILGSSTSVYSLTFNNYGGANTYEDFVDSQLKRSESLKTYSYWHRRFVYLENK